MNYGNMKEKLKNLLKNPIGICLVVIHWIIALVGLSAFPMDNYNRLHQANEIAMIIIFALFVIDILAIIPTMILSYPIYYFVNPSGNITKLEVFIFSVLIFSFFTITFQWLLVGRIIHNFFWRKNEEITLLNISDE